MEKWNEPFALINTEGLIVLMVVELTWNDDRRFQGNMHVNIQFVQL